MGHVMKDKQINWYTVAHRKPQQNQKAMQAIIGMVQSLNKDFPMMYSYKHNEDDVKVQYQFIEPIYSRVTYMINAKEGRMEIWIPMQCTDDEPLEM